MEFKGRKKMHHHLNITPLIDIVFLLLIFFMLTASFINQKAIKVELPEAAHAEEQTEDEIVVSIDRERCVFLGADRIEMADLSQALKERVDGSATKNVVIRGDKSVDFGTAVKVMDIARSTGAEGMMIVTELEQ